MAMYTKESLEMLRQKVDLVDLLSSHLDLKRSGASYKALCPFHDEKSPSFIIQKGDSHYHCFGCGAHGDAIQFLMTHLRMSFADAVESLAEKFQVPLMKTEAREEHGPNKAALKEALLQACRLYHYLLLHTPEGHAALQYLYQRGIDLEFIKKFSIGFAPHSPGVLQQVLHAKSINNEIMVEAGLLVSPRNGWGFKDFFADRITFPIHDAMGSVIGFSARKFKEETYGGKYVNTPETPIFKKSRVLFGLNYSRRRMAKERKAIIVEGQIDALRLIYAGFDYTVAGQGTAFGAEHVKQLTTLGIKQAFLVLDGDNAGREATRKIGHLFQKEGVEVRVVRLPSGTDPDSFLRLQGVEAFVKLLDASQDYVKFLVDLLSQQYSIDSPAGKNELVREISQQIRSWDQPVMVHESLRQLARLTNTPEELIGVDQEYLPNLYIKKSGTLGTINVDPDRVLECDFLRWLLLMGESAPRFVSLAREHLAPELLQIEGCRRLYALYLERQAAGLPCGVLDLSLELEEETQGIISELLPKKVNREKAEKLFLEALQHILERNWMKEREAIRMKLQQVDLSDEEQDQLLKQFKDLTQRQPKLRGA